MNKTDAAHYLGIGVRSLERYTSAGRIQAGKKKVKTGYALDYDVAALDSLKSMLDAEAIGDDVVDVAASVGETLARLPRQTSVAIVKASPQRERPTVGIEHKLLLTLEEASALTGLSRGVLRQAIEDKKLKAAVIGRGFKMRREDLETYIRKLF